MVDADFLCWLYDISDEKPDVYPGSYPLAFLDGAASAFGLMGMAEAIRQTHWRLLSTFLAFDVPAHFPADLWAALRDGAEGLRREHERFRDMLETIRDASISEADQCPFWARFALEGKDINGAPLPQGGKDSDE